MNQNDLFQAFGDLDDDVLVRSEAPVGRLRVPGYLRWGVLAACLILAVSLAGVAFVVEAKEYSEAAKFFVDNDLSMEGLSRSDVKAVYRDITTRSFSYVKTAKVLERAVPGWEIDQREPTREELAALWDQNIWKNEEPEAGIHYLRHWQEKFDAVRGVVLDKSILSCYRDGDLLWTAQFDGIYVNGSVYTSAETAVWGYYDRQPSHAIVARIDGAGNILWQRQMNHGFGHERVSHVLDNGDGTFAVISRGDFKYFCLSQYDVNGNEISFHQTEVGDLGIWNAARLGDGYLIQMGNSISKDSARLVKLNREGELINHFIYEGEDCDYTITDMAEFGNQVYLSAYAVPKQSDGGGRHEIADILDYLFDNKLFEISSEKLTPLVRDNYTAVLLLCDQEKGQPETFYSVKGSLGGKLVVNDAGELVWEVESVADTFFSPVTSSFTIGGNCQVFRYTFDDTGVLRYQEDTGEMVPYYR
ncbi:MAG: hypothetical protein K2N63_01825 [Lachnospiraceae bacterium]|nr:hypothetical protein [Lachnospiraceae bacterium]